MTIFYDVKKERSVFLITRLLLIFVEKKTFFREYIEIELKIIFVTSE